MAEKEQIPLNLQRQRVPLEEYEELRIRVPRRVAEAVEADPAAAMKAMARAGEEKLAALGTKGPGFPADEPRIFTPWATAWAPTWDGWYDVTDSLTGTMNERWWYCGSSGSRAWFTKSPQEKGARRMMHDEFVERSLAWRGLKEAPPSYPTPPYWPQLLPDSVAIDGKYIKRSPFVEDESFREAV